MPRLIAILSLVGLLTTPMRAAAQGRGWFQGAGGFATTSEATAPDVSFQLGMHVAPRLIVFGDVGRLMNVEPSLAQGTVDAAVASLAANNFSVTGESRVPAWYTAGGVRFEIPTNHVTPFFFGAVGYGRTSPNAMFTYTGQTTLSGATAVQGSDATADVTGAGYFVAPQGSGGALFKLGGGVHVPITPVVGAEVGYAWSRLALDTPLTAQSVTFGIAVRF
jgi:hypothetical protein